MKDQLAQFSKKNGWWGDPFYLKFWAAPIGAKSPILDRYSFVAPQP